MKPLPFFPRRTGRLAGSRKSALDLARGRLVLVSIFFALAYMLVAARVFDLSVLQGALHHEDIGDSGMEEAAAFRADITDRNGVLLATSLKTESLYADPDAIMEKEKVAAGLAKAIPDLKYADTLQKLQRHGSFVWLRRNLTPQEQFAVLELGQPGLQFRPEMRRLYPEGALAEPFVGYTDIDGNGLAGVEHSFEKQLRASDTPLPLSLDVRLQHILRRETAQAISDFGGDAGAGLIMDMTTGQLLAAVSLPDYDPNDPPGKVPSCDKPDQPPPPGETACPTFSRVTLGTYELGSTFKIFTLASLFENLNPPLSTTYDASHPLAVGKFKIEDFEPEGRALTVPEVFQVSSNIGAAMMARSVGIKPMVAFYDKLGLLRPAPLEVREIGRPQYPRTWQELNIMTAGFGHGIAVSPLQLVTAAASIVMGGGLIRPTLLADATPSTGDRKLVSQTTMQKMRALLRLVVTDGTGTNANVAGYDVGGKTGTAEKPGPHGYQKKHMISSFLGFFPMDKPRYAIYIMVDEPHGTAKSHGFATGGWVAAPAVARVIASMAAVLGLTPHDIAPGHDLTEPLRPYLHGPEKKGGGGAAY